MSLPLSLNFFENGPYDKHSRPTFIEKLKNPPFSKKIARCWTKLKNELFFSVI